MLKIPELSWVALSSKKPQHVDGEGLAAQQTYSVPLTKNKFLHKIIQANKLKNLLLIDSFTDREKEPEGDPFPLLLSWGIFSNIIQTVREELGLPSFSFLWSIKLSSRQLLVLSQPQGTMSKVFHISPPKSKEFT